MKKGIITGAFDVIHPGYIDMFEEAKSNCDLLIIALHSDPSIERPEKLKPILKITERYKILNSIKYVDVIVTYETEKDLVRVLIDTKPDVRFMGTDYVGKTITGGELNIPIHYIDRSHGWSTTKFKKSIYEQIHNKII